MSPIESIIAIVCIVALIISLAAPKVLAWWNRERNAPTLTSQLNTRAQVRDGFGVPSAEEKRKWDIGRDR